jgi:hypothetical protein
MTPVRVVALFVAAASVFVTAAEAQSPGLALQAANGRVTIDASNVPVGRILERWAQVQRITIVNGDTLSNAPVTLRLDGVPEREALAILLRGASGYIATRRANATGNGFEIDRILIVRSSAPAASASAPLTASGRAGQRTAASTPVNRSRASNAEGRSVDREPADSPDTDPIAELVENEPVDRAENASGPEENLPGGIRAQAPGLTPEQRALLQAPAPDVYTGVGPPNLSSAARRALAAGDASLVGPEGERARYGDVIKPEERGTAAPFGVGRTAAQPGATPGKP